MQKLMEKVEAYGFECEAGPLRNCEDWNALRASAAEKDARIAELEGGVDEVCESTADFFHSLGRYENGDPRMPWSGIRQDIGILHENYDSLKSLLSTPTGAKERIEKAVWEEVAERLGHKRIKNPRCGARHKTSNESPNRPPARPVWCDLNSGHEGPHKHASGHHIVTLRENLTEMAEMPDVCEKCRENWPCTDVRAIFRKRAEGRE